MFLRTESFKGFIRFYPIVTFIIAIQLLLWLSLYIVPSVGDLLYQLGIGHNYSIGQGEYWRLVTPIFLHNPNSMMHLLFNSFSLVIFGPALEQMLGKAKFIFTYLFTGICGNVFTFLMDPTAYIPHLGASGAIYGLFGLYLFMVLFRKHLIDRGNAQIVVTILVVGALMTFMRSNINIYGHLFGFIGGLALGPIVLNKVKPFSMVRNRRPVRNDSGVNFNPNRWNKRGLPIKKYMGPILWAFIGLLVLFGLIGRFL